MVTTIAHENVHLEISGTKNTSGATATTGSSIDITIAFALVDDCEEGTVTMYDNKSAALRLLLEDLATYLKTEGLHDALDDLASLESSIEKGLSERLENVIDFRSVRARRK